MLAPVSTLYAYLCTMPSNESIFTLLATVLNLSMLFITDLASSSSRINNVRKLAHLVKTSVGKPTSVVCCFTLHDGRKATTYAAVPTVLMKASLSLMTTFDKF